jgi:hypothetical protein
MQRLPLCCRCMLMWLLLRTYPLNTSYCIPFRTLSITHSSVFFLTHGISGISTQQLISRNLFTFRPMLIEYFLLNWGWGIHRESLWHRFWDNLYTIWLLILNDYCYSHYIGYIFFVCVIFCATKLAMPLIRKNIKSASHLLSQPERGHRNYVL